jgi:hypothetical protein
MNTYQLWHILEYQDLCTWSQSIGVYSSDNIPKPKDKKNFFIINLDPASEPGSHWIALYIYQHGNKYKGEVFDSFGEPIRVQRILEYLRQTCGNDWIYNAEKFQRAESTVCGHYCIYFITQRCRGITLLEILNKLRAQPNPDVYVYSYVTKNYVIKHI